MKSVFNDLLEMTRQQPEPQRLLFLFAQTEDTKGKIKKHQSGSISPVMCVDKLPQELTDFSSLKSEADSVSKNWDFIFIAGLSGSNGEAPSSDDAEPYLNKMTNDLANGQDLSRYVVINRDEQAIEIAPF